MKRFNTLYELGELIPWSVQGVGVASMKEFQVSPEEHRAFFDLLTKGTVYSYILENKPLTFRGTVLKINEDIK